MAKNELTISQFRELIKEEAIKLKKRMVLENEKKELTKELKNLNESYIDEDEELDESWWKRTQGDEDRFMKDLKTKKISIVRLGGKPVSEDREKMLIAQAEKDGYAGTLQVTKKGQEGELVYIPAKDSKAGGPGVTSIGR